MAIVPPHRIPVIVGVADVIDRPADLAQAREPAALMVDALLGAFHDAAGSAAPSLLAALDSLDIVAEHSWPYAEPCDVLTARLGHTPKRCVYGVAGGESPVRFIHAAALRIASGDSTVAAVVGAESQHSVAAASKQSVQLPWSPRGSNAGLLRGKDLCHPIAISHGMTQPVHVYPFYENAATAAWGQTPVEAMRESAELWSNFSSVAAETPSAWLKQSYSADQLATPSQDNRPVAWPYTKHMVANPFVNQGAAVVLTSLAKARELGIAEERCVFIQAGARAIEPRDYLLRDQYQRSYAQEAVLEAMRDAATRLRSETARSFAREIPSRLDTEGSLARQTLGQIDIAGSGSRNGALLFDAVELYSCFPIVPKMARRALALPTKARLTAIGGLSFFGAPLNNYMTHAAAGLVRQLRNQHDGLALLYGQGEFVTKHHALLLSSSPPEHDLAAIDDDVQARADRQRRPVAELIDDFSGSAALETFTVVYGRGSDPDFGTVIACTHAGHRLMARVAASDSSSLQALTNLSTTPIGRVGQVTRGADNLLYWTVT
ncbi:acetyl-CoA acetyltransferase [Steroidobacter agaridevorans]|uniref:Acetyl-CoA acetyltransferase n=1 Tax=Steroidobacter agaridevorans TaxID=2695856 RepID=A0A829YF60_9GAMM|nr:acetyl-CoA acetyltransferase [Steroidobacter agaridevorans]GFE81840.1 acetyl-CoA acetyltransferase [Steroidobacter agaridevorans]